MSLFEFIENHPRIFVLTGAGVSTGSGIPDYRDSAGAWKHRKPVDYRDFVREHAIRQRYWARSAIGWPRISGAEPNAAHICLASLEKQLAELFIVTQNVDGLHQRAGSSRVIDLHGTLDHVVCLDCASYFPRIEIQEYLLRHNPQLEGLSSSLAPDGDAQRVTTDFSEIKIPHCDHCDGMLKPDVVFFGENVPGERITECFDALEQADAVLVVGSSLMVYSGYRFMLKAQARNIPIAAINLGKTRADDLLSLKIERDCGETLTELVKQIARPAK
ncbi:MAG: NAD-dependent protein deacetylase [Gammaproteobacteria bacterium]